MSKGYKKFLLLWSGELVSAIGGGLTSFGLRENLILICASGFAFFAMIPIANSSLDYLVRTNIANDLQGRVWGLTGFISRLGYVFAYGLCGVISDQIASSSGITVGRGSARVIMAAGIGLILLAGILYLSKSVRQLERAEESVQSQSRKAYEIFFKERSV